jgi:hypothetical protein
MNRIFPTVAAFCLSALPMLADEPGAPEDAAAKHAAGAEKVADQQDELSADVGQLVIEQTVPKVIELLNSVSEIMDEATDKLTEHDTGGDTLAAQTEIIEKIHEAAKERQKQNGAGAAGGAMMDMMERMMGKDPNGDQKGKGKEGGKQGGQGATGESDAANGAAAGAAGGKVEERRVPKASGAAGRELPEEFRKALDAYNRGAEKKVK